MNRQWTLTGSLITSQWTLTHLHAEVHRRSFMINKHSQCNMHMHTQGHLSSLSDHEHSQGDIYMHTQGHLSSDNEHPQGQGNNTHYQPVGWDSPQLHCVMVRTHLRGNNTNYQPVGWDTPAPHWAPSWHIVAGQRKTGTVCLWKWNQTTMNQTAKAETEDDELMLNVLRCQLIY